MWIGERRLWIEVMRLWIAQNPEFEGLTLRIEELRDLSRGEQREVRIQMLCRAEVLGRSRRLEPERQAPVEVVRFELRR